MEVKNTDGEPVRTLTYPTKEHIISEETSETMQYLLEQVVKEGSGNKAYIPGYKIGGKTATSQTLPRSAHKYISSFLGFAPADDPQVLCLLIINNPQGIYYGGTIAAPIVKDIFGNILPYMGIEQRFTEEETQENNIGEITMPDLMGKTKEEMQEILKEFELSVSCIGEDGTVTDQFPLAGETISKTSNVIVYLE